MPRSKLEKYLSILEVLIPSPLKFEKISYKAKIEWNVLRRCLNFLISYKLVEERVAKKGSVIYAITERGLAVFKTLQAQKYFKKLRRILPVVEEANEVGPLLSKHSQRFEEET